MELVKILSMLTPVIARVQATKDQIVTSILTSVLWFHVKTMPPARILLMIMNVNALKDSEEKTVTRFDEKLPFYYFIQV